MVKEDEILPFPFVVDTGASGTMYLGRKMKEMLEEMNVIQGVATFLGPYRIRGTFTWKERTLANPIVNILSSEHEIDGDDGIRVNVTRFAKIDHVRAYCIMRNTNLKY